MKILVNFRSCNFLYVTKFALLEGHANSIRGLRSLCKFTHKIRQAVPQNFSVPSS